MGTPETTTHSGPSRRLSALLLGVLLLLAAVVPAVRVAAQDGDADAPGFGDVPSTGVRRPGPIGPTLPLVARREGALPVAIRIEKAGVDAPVETVQIVDGVMQNPTGPWVVSWYQETAKPGGNGNAVMAGHVDYWEVGPAVFANLGTLAEGDTIEVVGEDGTAYTYAVEWTELYENATAPIQEIVGETEDPSLTLITCGGEFNYDTGEYVSRYVVRAVLTT